MEKSRIAAWELKDSIGILSIDNPPQNYLTEPDFLDLVKLKEWTADETLKGIIITGKGRHFSAGADYANLKPLSKDPGLLFSKMTRGKKILNYLDDIEVPTIAAIRGACFGGGLEIALACHIRVCSQNALFAFPETNLNLLPGLGGTVRLPEKLPFSTALQILLSGGIVSAEKALEIRLADHLVPSRQVYNFSLSLMKKMVDNRPIEVIRSVVRALNNSRRMSAREAMEEETRMFCELAVKILDNE
jgi:enoyl-CoA hydratase/carnithine racemase